MTGCTVCGRLDVDARGLCNAHYQRWRKHGDPLYIDLTCALSETAKSDWSKRGVVGIHGINPITRQPCGAPLRPAIYFGHAGAYCDACRIGGHPTVSPAGTSGVLP